MAIMFLNVGQVARGRGGNAVAKAAYVARERLRDARSGVVHDYGHIGGLEHAEIMLPTGTVTAGTEWARDRATLWNRAEAAERNRNARVATEYTVALPHELTPQARLALAQQFAQRIADRYGTAVDLAVHGPTPRGDPRNHHAHILATTRELDAEGFGRKATIQLSTEHRRALGLQHIAYEFRELRAQWAGLANEKLREANVEARLEPRSRATLARESARREREAAAIATAGAHAGPPIAPAPGHSVPDPAPDAGVVAPRLDERAPSIEAAQQRAAEQWLAYRAAKGGETAKGADRDRTRDRELDAGFEL